MGNSSSVPTPVQAPTPPPMFIPGDIEQHNPKPQEPSLPPMFVPGEKPKVEVVNPGPYDLLHAHAEEIHPHPFEGAKLTVNKNLSNHFQINHNVALTNNPDAPAYTFGSTYVHSPSLVLAGSMTPSGIAVGNITGVINDNTRYKAVVQQHKGTFQAEMSVEHSGKDYVASAKVLNVDPIEQSGIGVLQYLQSCGKRLALGAELFFNRHANIPGKQKASVSLGGRYTGDDWALAGTVDLDPSIYGLKLSGCKKINQNVEVAAGFDGSLVTKNTSANLGWKYSLPNNTVFKSSVNTDLVVVATMEKELYPLPIMFGLSGIADQKNGQYGWGIGLTFG